MLNITSNDLENIPIGLMALWSGLLFGKSAEVHTYAAISFATGRVLHTIAYTYGLQPWRLIFYATGMMSTWVMIGNTIAGIF